MFEQCLCYLSDDISSWSTKYCGALDTKKRRNMAQDLCSKLLRSFLRTNLQILRNKCGLVIVTSKTILLSIQFYDFDLVIHVHLERILINVSKFYMKTKVEVDFFSIFSPLQSNYVSPSLIQYQLIAVAEFFFREKR